MKGQMKAVRMYKPKDLRLETVEIPQVKDTQVLIKVMAVGICGSDIPRVNHYGAYISPITPGHEFAGEVVETGAAVKDYKAGDRVTLAPLIPCYQCKYCEMGEYSLCEKYNYYGSRCDGAFAQYIAVEEKNLLKIADTTTFETAATTDPLANALHGLKRAQFKAGESVCVYGCGAIGLYTIQAAKALGASHVVAVDVSPEKLDSAKACGAEAVFNGRDADVADQVKKYLNGGADVVTEISGNPIAQQNCILSAAKLGRIVILGISHKGLELSEKAVDTIMRGQLSVIGSWNSFSKPFPGWEWTTAVELFTTGKVKSDAVITHRLLLEDVADTFKKLDQGGLFFNKILFFPWGVTTK
jgi:L-iditol 2-dehydrogenase